MLITYDQAVREAAYLGQLEFFEATEAHELWLDLVTPALLARAATGAQEPVDFGQTVVGKVDQQHVHALCAAFLRGNCRHIANGDRATATCPDGVHYCPRHAIFSPARSNCLRCYDLGMLPSQQQAYDPHRGKTLRDRVAATATDPAPPATAPRAAEDAAAVAAMRAAPATATSLPAARAAAEPLFHGGGFQGVFEGDGRKAARQTKCEHEGGRASPSHSWRRALEMDYCVHAHEVTDVYGR